MAYFFHPSRKYDCCHVFLILIRVVKNLRSRMINNMVKRFTLPKKGKLCQNKNFQAVYKSGKSYANKNLVVYVLPNQSVKRRVGFAAGKRLGSAVMRNRLKRLLREAYRHHQEKIITGVDLVLVARQPLLDAGVDKAIKAFLDICAKAKILVK
ncbi:MAG: rnpA [Firmicutes bacterium]|nr:rnpA [Bacillota bacterium]